MTEQIEFLKLIARRLDDAQMPFMLTGSLAMSLYAEPRTTRDIDLVIECGRNDEALLMQAFSPDCYIDEAVVREAIQAGSMFNVIHKRWIVKADFILRKEEEYRRTEFSRRRRILVEGQSISVVAPEDLLLSKLLWAQPSDSERQLRDARALLAGAATMDRAYLEIWSERLGLQDLLRRLENP